MKASITLETVSEDLLRQVFEAQANGDDDALDALWDDIEQAVLDAVRSEFSPDLLVHVVE